MPTLPTLAADFQTQLAGAVSAGDTTATLVSATDDDGVVLPTGLVALTIDGSTSLKEYILCTLTGTALTAVQNTSRQNAQTSGFARAHRVGAKVTITDWAALAEMADQFNRGAAYVVVPLTDAATIATDASLGNIFDVTLEGNRTLGAPTNPTSGQFIEYRIKQDGVGGHTLTYNAIFDWTVDVAEPILSTGAGKIDSLLFQYNLGTTKWIAMASNLGAN